jgi:hypothetical protein
MNNKFDELTKAMAQSVTRRQAFKKFGLGIASMALACFGLANRAEAAGPRKYGAPCATNADCNSGYCQPQYHICGCVSDKDCLGKHTICENGLCFGPIA